MTQQPPPVVDTGALPGGVRAAVEAILIVADEPVSSLAIATVLEQTPDTVAGLLTDLAAEYRGERGHGPRGFELREVGNGWRLFSAPAFSDVVGAFVLDGQTA